MLSDANYKYIKSNSIIKSDSINKHLIKISAVWGIIHIASIHERHNEKRATDSYFKGECSSSYKNY